MHQKEAGTAKCDIALAASSVSKHDGKLWTRSTPEAIAKTARCLFGTDAAQAIEWCALSARNSHREADLRFWRGVLALLGEPAADGEL
ncbi:hypothetical protein [Mesorhizobium sp. M8A.F.Ca.ET.161.01.1.1]|uniref:hypothetical protein n=1 Tax=Mesorhizobium sp. M8A.F.Ca.ET.161.01.1.1 TaxID=2563959 RepID=UPI000FCB30D5|nr:hypothetical protein [Mesorhizobium sp. M8A.F.Ca.ET.161.01.1.1]TGT91252.1 hypothetical protein EN804_08015 [Mesorhizobium sp. M8A.F.Ca.ET.161.01.1.1]TGV43468.1 hypothetical protein EN785_05535 [Mesorhizobium sp. M8A.F.Ca.ET.142.01.1.1]